MGGKIQGVSTASAVNCVTPFWAADFSLLEDAAIAVLPFNEMSAMTISNTLPMELTRSYYGLAMIPEWI